MLRQLLHFTLLAIITVLLAGCGGESWHRKLTLTIDTPHGRVTGFAVQRESIVEKGGWWATPEARGAASGLTGEAVVVEVAPGKYLFALLSAAQRPDTFEVVFPGQAPLEVAGKMAGQRQPFVLDNSQYPLLVTFTDITDPKSVKKVEPANLAASFGPGYALKSIILEITDEPVTEGKVESVLGWLGSDPGQGVCEATGGPVSQAPFCRKVVHGSFIRR